MKVAVRIFLSALNIDNKGRFEIFEVDVDRRPVVVVRVAEVP